MRNLQARQFFLLSSFCLVTLSGFSQASFFKNTYAENLSLLDNLYSQTMLMEKSRAFESINQLKKYAIENHSESWELEAKMLKVRYLSVHKVLPYTELVQLLEEIAQTAEEKNIFHLHARAIWDKANIFSLNIKNFELALEEFSRLSKLLEKTNTSEFPNKTYYLYEIGEIYYFFGDYDRSISLLKEVAKIPATKYNAEAISSTFNTLGLIYRDIGKLDSSNFYFEKVLENNKVKQKELWKSVATGNIGHNEYLKGNYNQAIPLLSFDFTTAEEHGDCGLASGSGTILADIYIEKKQPEKSKYFIDAAMENIRISGQKERLRRLYPVMSKYFAEINHPELAKAYVDSTISAMKSYEKETSSIQLLRLEQKEAKRREEQLKLEQEKRDERRKTLLLTLLIFGLGISGLSVVSYKRLKASQKLKSYQLEMAKYQLEQYSKTIEKNNAIIADLKKEKKKEVSRETIQKLRQSSLLTEGAWEDFQDHFTRIFPRFIQQLKKSFPTLTPTEIRYLVLLKLGFSNNKIASALGVSPSSLRVTWHRMKKKLRIKHASPQVFITKLPS